MILAYFSKNKKWIKTYKISSSFICVLPLRWCQSFWEIDSFLWVVAVTCSMLPFPPWQTVWETLSIWLQSKKSIHCRICMCKLTYIVPTPITVDKGVLWRFAATVFSLSQRLQWSKHEVYQLQEMILRSSAFQISHQVKEKSKLSWFYAFSV